MLFSLVVWIGVFLFPQCGFTQSASFTFSSTTGSFCAPAALRFQPTFSRTPISYFWQFGYNNEESDEARPTFNYTVPGVYKAVLVVLFDNKILEVENYITIYGAPTLTINASKTSICKPEQVDFTLQADMPLSAITWDFGDSSTQNGNGGLDTVNHYFSQFRDYNISVTAVSDQGCQNTANTLVSLQKPTATLSAVPTNGCSPITVDFKANVNVPSGSIVTSYTWNFNDGSPEVSGTMNTYSHTYQFTDTFKPYVSIITNEGCTNGFYFPEIMPGGTPTQAKIWVEFDTVCAAEKVKFVELNSNATKYIWEISNGVIAETVIGEFSFKFNSLGNFQVKVTPEDNGCLGLPDSLNIEIQGVVARFSYSNTCADKNIFSLRNTSMGRSSITRWNFGDGSAEVFASRPIHQFPVSGAFPVLMYVKDNLSGCADSVLTNIYTAQPVLVPTDTFLCRGSTASLKVVDTYTNPRALYTWGVAGQTISNSSDSSVLVGLSSIGLFSNSVIINNGSGYCKDTLTQPTILRVGGPFANFVPPANICLKAQINFFDSSVEGFYYDKITAWNWDFGNGLQSAIQNPQDVSFSSAASVPVKLWVRDNKGCEDSIQKNLRIRRLPMFRITTANQKVCEGVAVTLNALTRTPIIWSPANQVSCSTCASTVAFPAQPTTYTATTTDTFGCSAQQSVTLEVWNSFSLTRDLLKDTSICSGATVLFDLGTTDKIVEWSPDTWISGTTTPIVSVSPLVTTVYTATVSDSGRCFTRSVSATIEVNPVPAIDMGPDLVLSYDEPFTIKPLYNGIIASYTWQPTSFLSCSNCPYPSGRATRKAIYTVDVVSDKGCSSSGAIMVSVECNAKNIWMPTAFTPNSDGLNDTYYPLTRGISEIRKFVIYNRYGEMVFQRSNFRPNDRSLGWNGNYKGQQQSSGGFIYFVEGVCELGDVVSKKGNFAIIR